MHESKHLSERGALVFGPDHREESLSFKLREINKLFVQGFALDLRPLGITVGQWQFLRLLWEYDGSYQQELSSMLGLTSAATVSSINMLERDGLALRTADPQDSRKFCIFLTEKGKALKEQLLPLAEQHLLEAVEDISEEELLTFDRLLAQMKRNLIKAVEARNGSTPTPPRRRARRGKVAEVTPDAG